MAIRCKSINIAFDGNAFLEDVNLEIPRDRISLLYGPSGSGKTTLFNILCGLAPPCDVNGEVFWGKTRIHSLSEANRKRSTYISLIFSTFFFLEILNVEIE